MGHKAGIRRVTAGAGIGCAALLAVSCGTARAPVGATARTFTATPARSVHSVPSRPASIVPWVDRPAPVSVPSAVPSPTPPPAKYAPCTAADLSGRPGRIGYGMPGMADSTQFLVLANVSNSACTLSGGPTAVIGVQADGRRVNLLGSASPVSWPELIGPANLRPGHSAQAGLATDVAGCQASCRSTVFSSVLVGIGDSGRVSVSFAGRQPFAVLGAPAFVSTFGVPAPPPPPGNVSPLNVLTATVAMPRTITAGTTVAYTVTLRNRSGHPLALRPCPSYEEFVVPLGTKLRPAIRTYYLNCQAVPGIGAHGSVTFSMRVAVPAFAGKARAAKYGWILQGTRVQAGGAVKTAPAIGSGR